MIIQAFFRGCKARALQKNHQRQLFESIQKGDTQNISLQVLTNLMNRLRFFFNVEQDSGKLVWLCQLVIRNPSGIMKQCQVERSFVFSLAQFFHLTLRYISETISSPESKGSHWRVLEIFLNSQNWHKNISDSQVVSDILGSIFGVLSNKGNTNVSIIKIFLKLTSFLVI